MIEITPETIQDSTLAVPVAPEDIRVGDFVASMNDVHQYVLRGCDADPQLGRPPQVHIVTVRTIGVFPRVYRVLAVGLPFVLVEDSGGLTSLLTCRLAELARLPPAMGRRAMRRIDRRRRRAAAKRREAAAERGDALMRPGAEGAD